MSVWVCVTCGTPFPESDGEPGECPICEDPRQYVPEDGQRWTTLEELRAERTNDIRDDGELTGVGVEPWFAIGQRALLVENLMWECVHFLDEAAAQEIERRGGLRGIALSHPHYYTGMVDWAHRFDCPVYVHAADERWIMRPDPSIELWDGDAKELGDGLTLVRCGGHFEGGTVLHWAGGGALLSGDIVQVIPDHSHVGFMYSYPNLIPLPAASVEGIARALEPYEFDTIYGAWWGRIVRGDAKEIVRRSAERYVLALDGKLP
jgi:glyoxylase-like metal-dependent hydrolase (beta-lactamase superfamily II)